MENAGCLSDKTGIFISRAYFSDINFPDRVRGSFTLRSGRCKRLAASWKKNVPQSKNPLLPSVFIYRLRIQAVPVPGRILAAAA